MTAWSAPGQSIERYPTTGQYPFRHGWTSHHDPPREGREGLSPKKFTTLPESCENTVTQRSLGKYKSTTLANDPTLWNTVSMNIGMAGAEGQTETHGKYWKALLQANGRRGRATYGPDSINGYLTDFIRRSKDRPFLIYYPMLLAHGPYASTPHNQDSTPDEKEGLYAGNVTYLDHLVGKIINSIDELGLRKIRLFSLPGTMAQGLRYLNGVYPERQGRGGRLGGSRAFHCPGSFPKRGKPRVPRSD